MLTTKRKNLFRKATTERRDTFCAFLDDINSDTPHAKVTRHVENDSDLENIKIQYLERANNEILRQSSRPHTEAELS